VFFAFPLNSKPNWRSPPWMTILLIVVNCIIYFGPQRSEVAAWDKAVAYYVTSDLPRLELPRYLEYLRNSGDRERQALADRIEKALARRAVTYGARAMDRDVAFQAELHAGHIVRAEEPDYAHWQEQRTRFDQLKGPSFTARWASNPGDWRPVTLITAAFLHGSAGHLVGNMVFLFVFGYTVEMTLGRWRFLLFYLLAGMAGEVGDLLARWGSPVIGLGASGAISGLMAMYAMLYGRRRIRFFYQLLFYFDYVKAPAIILLPIWIGHEFLQQWLNPEGGIAYMAHAGGLIGGALLIAWHKHVHPETAVPVADEPPIDGYAAKKAEAEAFVKAMQLDQACTAYGRLAKLHPFDRDVLARYFNLAKLTHSDAHLHRAASDIFALDGDDPTTDTLLHETFQAYWVAAKPRPLLSADKMTRLAIRFSRCGQIADAERLGRLLLAQYPAHQHLPSVLLGLARAELARGGRERAAEHVRALATNFADSPEARIASELAT
jgi:membrane associated rhomboid family serine protease